MEPTLIQPFNLEDIDDVRVIIKAKGKHWSIVPKAEKGDAKVSRIAAALFLLDTHCIVDKPLEDIVNDKIASAT